MKLLLAAVMVIVLTTSSNACSPELHCMLKYGVTKLACKTLAEQGPLQQQVKDSMSYDDDGKELDLNEYNNIPKVQAACKNLGINLKK